MTQRMDAMALKQQVRINKIVNIEINVYKVLNNYGFKKKALHFDAYRTKLNKFILSKE